MADLIYTAIASLDGYVSDEDGKWDWSVPDPEVHAFVNDLERPVGTHLYGRRMYEVLVAWETMDDPDPLMRDYAEIWRGAEKIVYSSTLERVSSARTRIEPRFDPGAVRELKAAAGPVAGFEVTDVAAKRAEMEAAGVEFIGPVHDGDPGRRWSHFRGPDGFVYELTQLP
jgi:hypothetical protein